MKLFGGKKKIKKNIKELNTLSKPQDDDGSINALPEHKIITMQGDLAELKGISEKEITTAPISEKKQAYIPVSKKLKKAPLPSTEELIGAAPKNLPVFEKIPKKKDSLKETSIKVPIPLKRSFNPLFIILIIIIILGGIGGFFYWQGKEAPPVIEPEPEQIEPSQSLIPVSETIIIFSPEKTIKEIIKEQGTKEQNTDTFKRIVIQKSEKEFFSLSELFERLEIIAPPYTMLELGENYTLFINNNKLGIAIEIKNSDNLKSRLRIWEETMLDSFKNFYLEDYANLSCNEFIDNKYKEIDIRYSNIADPIINVNYAIANNLLIIGISKNLMYNTIDKIVDNL